MLTGTIFLLAALYGDLPDAKHAWAVHDWNRPKPVKVTPAEKCGGAPSDAVVLFDGTKESFERNWCDSKGKVSKWKLGTEGDFYCVAGGVNGGGVFTREHFGDCQLHLEFRHDENVSDHSSGPQMRGNSGVFLMGPNYGYEIQVLESYYTSQDAKGTDKYVDNYTDGQAGSVYAENPPLVNPARKPGKWQTYDIVFHQPVWEGLKLIHPGSVTVFFNGVLVQDHWLLEGLTTHCKRRPLKPHPKKGPLFFQDHGCKVHFRNIWYRPISSRMMKNRTNSIYFGDENEVMALRRDTAGRLYSRIANPEEVSSTNLLALAEVISYANEGAYAAEFSKVLEAYRLKPDARKDEVNRSLKVLIRGKIIPENSLIQ